MRRYFTAIILFSVWSSSFAEPLSEKKWSVCEKREDCISFVGLCGYVDVVNKKYLKQYKDQISQFGMIVSCAMAYSCLSGDEKTNFINSAKNSTECIQRQCVVSLKDPCK